MIRPKIPKYCGKCGSTDIFILNDNANCITCGHTIPIKPLKEITK